MTRDETLARLRDLKPWLEAQGIVNVRLFGSHARDQAGIDSDIDLLVETARPMGLEFLTVERLLGERLGHPVEFCSPEVMHPAIRARAESEAVVV